MKKNKPIAILVFLAIAVIFLFSSACSAWDAVSLKTDPTLTMSTRPTTTLTATPTASPSTTIDQEKIEEAKSNQNIQYFINKTGDYSDEAMNDRYMTYNGNQIALGWMGEGEGTLDFQGEFFGYVRNGDYLVLAVGFNGTDGQNHVKPIAIPIEFFRYSDGKTDVFPFQFLELGDWSLLTSHKLTFETSLEGVVERLCLIKGKPVILSFSAGIADDVFGQGIGRFGEKSRCYFEELMQTSALYSGLMSEIVVKANEEIVLQKTKYPLKSDTTIPDIVNMEDLKNIDISLVPRIFAISSNLW